jgi:uncharacterized protein YcgL (UPF0745 family)
VRLGNSTGGGDTARMKCFVYRCGKRAETYVYLRERDAFGLLPPELAGRLGALTLVLELDLVPERRLAREDAGTVRRNLVERGFHVQLPPPEPPARGD